MTRHKSHMLVDLTDYIGTHQLHGLGIGYDDKVYILSSEERIERRSGNHPLVKSSEPHDYTVTIFEPEEQVSQITITEQKAIYSYVQPLSQSEVLLVNARSRLHSPYHYDKNAKVFDYQGNFVREFLLGDGLSHVQTTSNGHIWTGYFDEGIFGNYGWGKGHIDDESYVRPVGARGLVHWDNQGNKLWEFDSATLQTRDIWDNYAMTIGENETIWLYNYNSSNELVCLRDGIKISNWRVPFGRIHQITVWQESAAFISRSTVDIWSCKPNHPLSKQSTHKLRPTPNFTATRGEKIIYYADGKLYKVTISDLL